MKGRVVLAHEVKPGDSIILPVLGAREVVMVEEFDEDTGREPGPRVSIVYRVVGGGSAYENRASMHGASTSSQIEATVRPLKPDERVAIEDHWIAA